MNRPDPHPFYLSTRRLLLVAILLLLPLFLTDKVSGQSRELFEVSGVVKDAKRRFSLNSRDLRAIAPFIEREKVHLVRIFARFNGEVPEYSHRLWNDLIVHRHETEAKLSTALTSRQALALRSATARLETRILNYIVEDYVGFLSQYLYLGDIEYDAIVDIFDAESKKKYALIGRHLKSPDYLRKEIENTDRATRWQLEKVLDREQWRTYLSLEESFELVG